MSLTIMTISKNLNKFIWIILLSLMANVTIADEELSLTSSDKDLLQAIQREILYLESEKLTLTNEKNRLIKSYLKAKNEVEESISELEKKLNDQNLKNKEKELVVKNLEEQSENFSDEKNTLESINNQIEEQLSLLGLKSSNNLIQNIEVIQKNLKSNSKIKIVTRDFYNDLGEKQQSSVLQVGQVLFWGQIMDQWKPLKFIEDNKLTTISNQESNEISFNTENKINNTAIQGVIIDKVTKIENEALEKSIIDTIGSGGAIGWLIVSLGGLAFIFSIIRFIFLNKSSKESII